MEGGTSRGGSAPIAGAGRQLMLNRKRQRLWRAQMIEGLTEGSQVDRFLGVVLPALHKALPAEPAMQPQVGSATSSTSSGPAQRAPRH